MELRYVINPTIRPLAERFFLPSIPQEFTPIEHQSGIYTSGDFNQDNYSAVITERTDAIQRELENRLDNSLMFWCDVDIEFYRDCAAELECLAEGKDLLFQKETADPTDRSCNFGVQIIRRTPRNLVFYSRIALLQRITDNCHDQPWGNCLLGFEDAPKWGHLPLTYSAEYRSVWRVTFRDGDLEIISPPTDPELDWSFWQTFQEGYMVKEVGVDVLP